ncbi:MAG: YqaJ viral recombinase family protein [Sinimarinibacterium flocculans]|uniref:YqaJ viral recombinase family protein n=1 Tax=Sinimarinibacterium flocculans TaxID=985250 RepID=UPI003C43C8E6
MRTLNLPQGSPEWEAHRAKSRNASDAPVVMGESPYVTRAELVRQYATGIRKEVDAATQLRFARGLEVEPALVALAESIVGDEFLPQVGVTDDGYLSASFDGVNYAETVICEVKQANAEKQAAIARGEIPKADFWQIVQQFAVCDMASKCIYLVGDGTPDGTAHMEILRTQVEDDIPKLRAAWAQFDADVAAYQPEPAKAEVVAAPVEGFGALMLRVEGRVLASNLDAFKAGAEAFIARLPKPAELQTDQDFADADAAVKACAEAESRIKAAKDAALAQMADVDAVMRAADTIAETIRAARLALDKAVKAEKENRRSEFIRSGVDAVRDHYASINATLHGYELTVPASVTADIGAAIKGLKSLASVRDKIATAVAQAKIAASQEGYRRRLCIAVIEQNAEHRALIPDAAALVATKAPDDIRNLIAARIAEHEARARKQAEEAAERERERIRAEERQRAAEEAASQHGESRDEFETDRKGQTGQDLAMARAANTEPPTARAAAVPPPTAGAAPMPAEDSGKRIKLGDINAAIAPLKVDAAGLAGIGFCPVGTEGAAKLYAGLPRIVSALIAHLQTVAVTHEQRAA